MQQAVAAYARRDWVEAERLGRLALDAKADYFDALNLLGIIAAQTRRTQEAAALLERAVAANPNNAWAHNNRGNTLRDLKRLDEALDSYDRALRIKPDFAEACSNRGNTLKELKRLDEALDSYDRALKIEPDYAEAYSNRGVTLNELKRWNEALDSYDRALKIKPDYAEAYINRGNTLQQLKRLDEALHSYDRALKIRPDYAEACNNRGITLKQLKRLNEALDSYDRALKIKPDYAEAHYNRGITLQELRRLDEALDSYERALKIKPDYAEACNNRGVTLQELKRLDEALDSFERALRIKPDHAFLPGMRLDVKMHLCDWSDAAAEFAQLEEKIKRNEKAASPLPVLALTSSLSLQRFAAEIWVNDKYPVSFELGKIPKRARHGKFRIGYFSADFHEHAVSLLTAGLFETHDKTQFELYAFSTGPDTKDEMRKRLENAFDHFIDVRNQSDREVAAHARRLEIDIAVDLGGHTANCRTGIFALRAAPLQVSYIGYLGTTGAEYIDYLIADRILIPEDCKQHFSEKIVYLPSYQANDSTRKIPDGSVTREALGLPETGFVYCCFNNSYKITPATFDGWMRILRQVEHSVLWLLEDNATAARNLRKEAVSRGVDAARLIFAQRVPFADYLARYCAADLFIDTLPYNAGATASDALWAGLPVLTCMGEAFASRVAASLLNAIGLGELVTPSQAQYEALAVELATRPQRLKQVRQKLETNRLTTPLFDTQLFARHLEAAYTQMVERYQADLPPEHIYVEPRV